MFLSMSTGTATVCEATFFTLLLLCATTALAFQLSHIVQQYLIDSSCDPETTCCKRRREHVVMMLHAGGLCSLRPLSKKK